MNEKMPINVVYRFVDGAHVFRSTDPLMSGLYVASTDIREAFDDVPTQAKTLLKLNHRIEGEVVHELTFDEFRSQLMSALKAALESHHRHIAGRDRVRGVLPPNSAISLRIREMVTA